MTPRRSVIALLALGLAGTAQASSFVDVPMPEFVKASAGVVLGTVESIDSFATADDRIYTHVTLRVEEVLKGALSSDTLTLRQPGGRVGDRQVFIHGSPRFYLGERVLVYLTRGRDGSLHTHHLAMGKFGIVRDATTRRELAFRDFGEAELFSARGRRLASQDRRSLKKLKEEVRAAVAQEVGDEPARLLSDPPSGGEPRVAAQSSMEFNLIQPERRWFEPDAGTPVEFRIDPAGDVDLGPLASTTAVEQGLAAWTDVFAASIELFNGGAASPTPLTTCDGESEILFNDPFAEIDPPSGCAGTLGLGGGCTTNSQTRVVNGISFDRQVEGNVVFADGFDSSCDFKLPCNFAEVATHEIGHALGLGHSSENPTEANPELRNATMFFRGQFDGRCAGLESSDRAAVAFVYPFERFCGDVNEDGGVDILDLVLYRRWLAGLPPGIADLDRCSVVGGEVDCNLADVERLRFDLVGAFRIENVCAAFFGGTQASPVTEDLTPCDPFITDSWEFEVVAGQTVLLRADTVDAATASDLRFSGECGTQEIVGDEEIACSFPPPNAFLCPETQFNAPTTATCVVHIDIFQIAGDPGACASAATANYILTVEVAGAPALLTLVRDDSVP